MVMGVLRRIPESRELNRERDASLVLERLRGSGARWGIKLVRANERNRWVRTFGARV
jgi:ribosomal protein L19E